MDADPEARVSSRRRLHRYVWLPAGLVILSGLASTALDGIHNENSFDQTDAASLRRGLKTDS